MTSCAACGGRITPMRTSSTLYRHVPGLPRCDVHPPVPRRDLDDALREADIDSAELEDDR